MVVIGSQVIPPKFLPFRCGIVAQFSQKQLKKILLKTLITCLLTPDKTPLVRFYRTNALNHLTISLIFCNNMTIKKQKSANEILFFFQLSSALNQLSIGGYLRLTILFHTFINFNLITLSCSDTSIMIFTFYKHIVSQYYMPVNTLFETFFYNIQIL